MKKLAKSYTPIMFAFYMSFLMSAFMSGVITLINTGFDSAYFARWGHAWLLATPCAFVVAYFARPVVLRCVSATVSSD